MFTKIFKGIGVELGGLIVLTALPISFTTITIRTDQEKKVCYLDPMINFSNHFSS